MTSETKGVDTGVRAVIVDIETSGLDTATVELFELGMIAIDDQFRVIDTFESVHVNDRTLHVLHHLEALAKGHVEGASEKEVEEARIVFEMHQGSGLWGNLERRANAHTYTRAGELSVQARNWIYKVGGVGLPMTGSNVANFDRPILHRVLPSVEGLFHYRNVDVSSIKEWIRGYSPELYVSLRGSLKPKGLHRTVADCCDTRDELKVYTESLLG